MKRWLFLGWIVLLGCEVAAQHLQIKYEGDPLPEKDKVWIERFLNHELEFYSRFGLSDTTKLQLTVFDKRQDALDYLDSIGAALSSLTTTAMYSPSRKQAIILGREKWKEESAKIVIHELTHHLSCQLMKRIPGWINEGFSEYFEHCELGKKGLKHTLSAYELGRIRTMYMLDEVDLKAFMDNTKGDFHRKLHTDENYSYILSHALVTFGLEAAAPDFMEKLIAALNRSSKGTDSSRQMELLYPGGFKQFEQDFADFCKRD